MSIEFKSFSKEKRFEDLVDSVKHCDLCLRMKTSKKVLSEQNGQINAKVLFVAEAPGRLGADKTGIPLWGDKAGDNFSKLLGNIGWERKDIFITNTILCNPKNGNGTNGTPKTEEIENCLLYLNMTINIVDPDLIITLGAIALKALGIILPHNYRIKKDVGKVVEWNNRKLIPLYHPGYAISQNGPLYT